jgi:hypothetical protein
MLITIQQKITVRTSRKLCELQGKTVKNKIGKKYVKSVCIK